MALRAWWYHHAGQILGATEWRCPGITWAWRHILPGRAGTSKGLPFSQSFFFTYVTCLWIIDVGIMWITRTCKFKMRLKQLLLYFRQTWCTKIFMTTSMWMTDRTSVDSYIGRWTLHRWCLGSPHIPTQVGQFQWHSRFPLNLHRVSFRILSLELSSPHSFSKKLVYPRLYVATEGLCIIVLGPVSSALHYGRHLRYSAHREEKLILFHSLEGFSLLTVDPLLLDT